jgi:hypothetical protein
MDDPNVIDRGVYWEIVYPDGSDQIPKDPNMVDSAAVLAAQQGDAKLADRLRQYAAQIRKEGMPHPIEGFGGAIIGIVAALILLMVIFGKKGR